MHPFLSLAAAGALLPSALAWGTVGHTAVAYIATNLMKPETAEYCKAILGDSSEDFIASIATWADTYRYQEGGGFSIPFHWIDAQDDPPTSCDVDYDRDCTAEGCIVSAIMNYTTIQLEQHEPMSLKWLVHFLGDIHQPLHDENFGAGGNSINVTFDGVAKNLHAVWDTTMLTKLTGGTDIPTAKVFASQLTERILKGDYSAVASSWFTSSLSDAKAAAMAWATEANDEVCTTVFPEGPLAMEGVEIDGAYYEKAVPVLEKLIAHGGYRLAAWLDLIATGSTLLGVQPSLPETSTSSTIVASSTTSAETSTSVETSTAEVSTTTAISSTETSTSAAEITIQTSTPLPLPTSSAPYGGNASSSIQLATSVVYATTTQTIIHCASTVTNCPAGSTEVITSTVALYTTICPISAVPTYPAGSEIMTIQTSTPAALPSGPAESIPVYSPSTTSASSRLVGTGTPIVPSSRPVFTGAAVKSDGNLGSLVMVLFGLLAL